jgi:hypothetical protein
MRPISLERNTSAGNSVLGDAAFANSLASAFLVLSMYSVVKPLKWLSILLTRGKYLLRVGSLAMYSFAICHATTSESMHNVHV